MDLNSPFISNVPEKKVSDFTPQAIPKDSVPAPLTPKERKKASYGALISVIIIMIVVIIGAFYAWGKRIAENSDTQQVTPATQSY